MASRSVNKVFLLGHLGKDAETRSTPSGQSVTSFTLATNRRVKDQQTGDWKDEPEWHNVVAWKAENVAPYLSKGKQVFVEGRLQTRKFQNKDGQDVYRTEVVCDDVILVSGGKGEGASLGGDEGSYSPEPVSRPRSAPPAQQRPPQAKPAARQPEPSSFDPGIGDDDVPF